MMQLYIIRAGERTGPLVVDEVNRQLATGRLSPSDMACSESALGWRPLQSFTGIVIPGAASFSAAPIGLARAQVLPSRQYAGFWMRVLAGGIDLAFLAAVSVAVSFPIHFLAIKIPAFTVIVPAMLSLVYFVSLWSSHLQATVGQRLCFLRVMRIDGGRVSFERAAGRFFDMLVSAVIFGLGFIMIAFSDRKRALHDRMAGTCVVESDGYSRI